MYGEGFSTEDISFSLELELRSSTSSFSAWVPSPRLRFEGEEDIKAACNELSKAGEVPLGSGISLESLKLRASCPTSHPELPTHSSAGKSSDVALKGRRKVFGDSSFVEIPVYEQKLLQCGNEVKGPAIIEVEDTTILVPEGKKYSIDRFLFGVIEEE